MFNQPIRSYGTKGSGWRNSMATVMNNRGVWGDMKYTFNGKTYNIPAKLLATKKRTEAAIAICKENDSKGMEKLGIQVLSGG